MKIAYFDCFSGIAGDMLLGAFLDCGVPLQELKKGLSSLPVTGWNIEATPVLQSGIHGLKVRVTLDGEDDSHSHKTSKTPHEDHHHDHEHSHEHHHAHAHGRSMAEIRVLIEGSELSSRVQKTALDIFGRIAVVEAELHHSTPDEIHFHEIGGVDSLIDICGAAWCLEYLEIDEVHCSALPYSTGFVDCAHGRMPVPAPATLKLLRGATMFPTGLQGEMITPTGAGIVAALAQSFGDPPAFVIQRVGSGAGTKTWPDRPNLLRVTIGDALQSTVENDRTLSRETLTLLETNIDDMNPELWDLAFERVFAAGALDAWLTPIAMKKNRSAQGFSALCETSKRDAVCAAILRETTTLGVRVSSVERWSLPREMATVQTPWGGVRVKIARWKNSERAAPEYEDVALLARQYNIAAPAVYAAAQSAWLAQNSAAQNSATNQSASPSDAGFSHHEPHSHNPHTHDAASPAVHTHDDSHHNHTHSHNDNSHNEHSHNH